MQSQKPAKSAKDLSNALYDDFKRQAIDEAKKRAVSQHVDYDTFKNMVLAAHLKPLAAPSLRENGKALPCWAFGTDGHMRKEQHKQTQLPSAPSGATPSTSGDFYREWQRGCTEPDARYRYLRRCGPALLRSLFRVEVRSDVLSEMLAVLDATWLGYGGAAEDAADGQGSLMLEAAFVCSVLEALAASGRFSLTLKLLGSSAKPLLQRLFSGLEAAANAAEGFAGTGDDDPKSVDTGNCGGSGVPKEGSSGGLQNDGDGEDMGTCSVGRVTALRGLYGC